LKEETDISPLVAVIIILLTGLVIALLLPQAMSARRLDRRAAQDYRLARGTLHLNQLEGPLSRLKRDVAAKESQIRRTMRELRQLKDQHKRELRRALCNHLVADRLTEVHGIGPRLQQRILSQCFRGDLRDLHRAQELFNIGPARQAALARWVRAREKELPRLMKEPFPGKESIDEPFRAKISSLEQRLDRSRDQLAEKQALLAPADTVVDELKSVQISNFRKALKDREPNIYVPNSYLRGVYAPWESPPDWFVTLLDRYGG
jgi:septal ring factor EnvC (AmiA/AmiB activator)